MILHRYYSPASNALRVIHNLLGFKTRTSCRSVSLVEPYHPQYVRRAPRYSALPRRKVQPFRPFPISWKRVPWGFLLLTPRAGYPRSFDPADKRSDTCQKGPAGSPPDFINPSSLQEMSGNIIAQGFLSRQQEPDTREHPNRQPDRPTFPERTRLRLLLTV